MRSCSVAGCDRTCVAKGMCGLHYRRVRDRGDAGGPSPERFCGRTCTVDGCDRKHCASGLCAMHRSRKMRTGNVGSCQPKIAGCGSGCITKSGYKVLTGRKYASHPNAYSKNRGACAYIPEHVLVMSTLLGRPLRKGESVHHLNGVRHDNRPENLELWVVSQPSGQRVSDRISDALAVLSTYITEKSLWPPGSRELLASMLQELV